jgi:hypothetical protein
MRFHCFPFRKGWVGGCLARKCGSMKSNPNDQNIEHRAAIFDRRLNSGKTTPLQIKTIYILPKFNDLAI